MNLYVSEHKKPYARYMSIKEFNAKHGTYIEENAEYEEYFKAAYEKGRKRAGIDEFITDKIYTIDEMGWKEKAKDLYEKGKRKAKELKKLRSLRPISSPNFKANTREYNYGEKTKYN